MRRHPIRYAICLTACMIGIYAGMYAQRAAAAGNPPGTVCTGWRYGKGGSKVCIRWTYPATTTTSTP